GQPKWIAVTAGLAGLALCDAYVYKNHGTPPHEGAYTMAALTVMILLEMCEAVFSPAMAVPGLVLARAVPLAVLMVSAVRVLFHHPPHLAPLGSISIRMLQFITALWLAAAVGVADERAIHAATRPASGISLRLPSHHQFRPGVQDPEEFAGENLRQGRRPHHLSR